MNQRFILLVILLTVLISTIAFSFSNREVKTEYNYFENITIDNNNQVDAIIGVLNIDNKKIFSSTIKLKNLKACIFNKKSIFTYDIYYSESNKNFVLGKNDFRSFDKTQIPTLSKKKLYIKLTLKFPVLQENLERNLYYSEIPKKNLLYIFDENKIKNKKFREFCNNVNSNQSIYKIPIINNI